MPNIKVSWNMFPVLRVFVAFFTSSIINSVVSIVVIILLLYIVFSCYAIYLKSYKVDSFTIEHRPRIILGLVRFEDTGEYLKITNDNKEVTIHLLCSVHNTGKTIAKGISIPKPSPEDFKGNIIKKNAPRIINLPPPIDLGPGQSYVANLKIGLGMKQEFMKDFIERINSGKETMFIVFSQFYTSEFNPSKEYKTLVSYKISPKEAIILRSEIK